MTARFEWVVQAASSLIDSHVQSNELGSRSAALAGGKILNPGNTAVTRVWENPKMPMILNGTHNGVSESGLTRSFSTPHWRASAGLA